MKTGGEFLIELDGCELVLPNQFTTIGAQRILRAAFWGESLDWYVGLCAHNQADAVPLGSMGEPSGLNGYARQGLPGDVTNWPVIGVVNGESYVESRQFTFTATGPYNTAVNRLFLTDGDAVVAISSAMPEGLKVFDEDFTTRYRLYIR